MRISMTESGGWTGLAMTSEIDTVNLPGEQARFMEKAMSQVARRSEKLEARPDQPLLPTYTIVAETSDGRVVARLTVSELSNFRIRRFVEILKRARNRH